MQSLIPLMHSLLPYPFLVICLLSIGYGNHYHLSYSLLPHLSHSQCPHNHYYHLLANVEIVFSSASLLTPYCLPRLLCCHELRDCLCQKYHLLPHLLPHYLSLEVQLSLSIVLFPYNRDNRHLIAALCSSSLIDLPLLFPSVI